MHDAALLDFFEDAIVIAAEDGRILLSNRVWQTLFPAAGKASPSLAACLENMTLEREGTAERPEILRHGGSWFEHRITRCPPPFPELDTSQPYWLHQLRDITTSWRLAEERHFLERLYRTLSLCNQTLVRAQDAKSLAQGVCDALVQLGAYHFADVSVWIDDGRNGYERLASAVRGEIAGNTSLVQRLRETSHDFVVHKLPELFARSSESRRYPASIPTDAFRDDFASPLAMECYPLIDGGKALGALVVASTPGEISRIQEFGLMEELAGDLAFGLETLALREKAARLEAEQRAELARQRDRYWAIVKALANTIEFRDPYTAGHQRRVQDISLRLAEILGLTETQREGLGLAASLHDIGKIHVPAEILARPGKLSEAEFAIVKEHADVGAEILAPIDFPWPVAEIVRQHHERIDGTGYPRGLRGNEILLEAQILAAADVIEAMATHRPYRPAYPLLDALQYVVNQRDKHFSGRIVDACLKLFIEQRYTLTPAVQANTAAAR